MKSGIRQVDLARKLGISQRAVSYALSSNLKHHSRLSAALFERVRQVARKYDYHPHRQAQLMRGVKSGVIGIISDVPGIEVAVERQRHIAMAIHAAGFDLFLAGLWGGANEFRRALNTMFEARVEGMVLMGVAADQLISEDYKRILNADIPMVSLGSAPLYSGHNIMSDMGQGITSLTEHVLSLGHRQLAYLMPLSSKEIARYPGIKERMISFKAAVVRAGLSPSDAMIVHEATPPASIDLYRPGKLGMKKILDLKHRPSVVLCSNDVVAFGAMAACMEAGVRVPDDIAVTGFDNNTLGQYTNPPLTSVAQPIEAVGRKAVEILVGLIRRETGTTFRKTTRLPCRLVVRESCGAGKREVLGIRT